MSFLKSVGKFAVEAGKDYVNEMARKTERVQEYMYKFEDMSDEQLIKKMKTSSNIEIKMACQNLLRQRGYGN